MGSTFSTRPTPQPARSEQKNCTITIDGRERHFILYLPAGYNVAKRPLIFVLHGNKGTPEGMMKLADFRPIADRDTVVLVYPEGIKRSWNDGRNTEAHQLGVNDVAFFSAMCDYLAKYYPIDSSRIYATGLSNGGFMTTRLGCELSKRFAAIAPVSGTYEAKQMLPDCHPARPVAAMYIHGTADPIVPYKGGEMKMGARGFIASHDEMMANWVKLDQCNPIPILTQIPDNTQDGTTVTETKYTGGSHGSEVVGYAINNGGHTWPGGFQYLPRIFIGITTANLNACEVIWAFFKRFKRDF